MITDTRIILVFFILMTLNGCHYMKGLRQTDEAKNTDAVQQKANAQLDALVRYSGYLSILTDNELGLECTRLREAPETQENSYYLALLITLSAGCGELTEAREIMVSEINQTNNENVHQYLLYQIAVTERRIEKEKQLLTQQQSISHLEHQGAMLEKKKVLAEEQYQELKSKLDELKSIEQTLNRREEGRVQ